MPRVLHVVESLDRGAVENWLIRTFREAKQIDPTTDLDILLRATARWRS